MYASLSFSNLPIERANSGPASSGAMTCFMIGSTSSLNKLVLATIQNVR
jgi:hypothetical protein